MCVGIFLSVLQVELSSGEADLEPVQVGVFMQEVAEWNRMDVSSPGHRFHPNLHSSGAQEELEESIWSLTWRKLDFPLYLDGFSIESAVWDVLPRSSCGGEQWDLGDCGVWGAVGF